MDRESHEDMRKAFTDALLTDMRQQISDAEIADKYESYYREVGPAHLSPEICEAIERDIDRRAKRLARKLLTKPEKV